MLLLPKVNFGCHTELDGVGFSKIGELCATFSILAYLNRAETALISYVGI